MTGKQCEFDIEKSPALAYQIMILKHNIAMCVLQPRYSDVVFVITYIIYTYIYKYNFIYIYINDVT